MIFNLQDLVREHPEAKSHVNLALKVVQRATEVIGEYGALLEAP